MPTYLDTTGAMRFNCTICSGCAGCVVCSACSLCMHCLAFPPAVALSVSTMLRPFSLAAALGTHMLSDIMTGEDGTN